MTSDERSNIDTSEDDDTFYGWYLSLSEFFFFPFGSVVWDIVNRRFVDESLSTNNEFRSVSLDFYEIVTRRLLTEG